MMSETQTAPAKGTKKKAAPEEILYLLLNESLRDQEISTFIE